jgi:uncharacterized protein YjbJ (UPF0337 family)
VPGRTLALKEGAFVKRQKENTTKEHPMMNINEQTLKGKWTQIKGEIQKTWGKVTGDEIEKNKGNMRVLAGLIQQRYGIAKEEASTKLSQLVNKFDSGADAKIEQAKDKLAAAKRDAKESLS